MTTTPSPSSEVERLIEELRAWQRERHVDPHTCEEIIDALSTQSARLRCCEEALRAARGWVVTCSESATARRDLAKIDAALNPKEPSDDA